MTLATTSRSLLLLASLVAPATAAGASGSAPAYDATGDWVFHVDGPHLLAGECDVTEEPGYDEVLHIEQDHGSFVISTADGQIEHGTVEGALYTHAGMQQGTDVTGVFFELETRSTFTLTSPDTSVGRTVLDLRFGDGSECLLDLRFEGQRVEQESRQPGTSSDPLRPA